MEDEISHGSYKWYFKFTNKSNSGQTGRVRDRARRSRENKKEDT